MDELTWLHFWDLIPSRCFCGWIGLSCSIEIVYPWLFIAQFRQDLITLNTVMARVCCLCLIDRIWSFWHLWKLLHNSWIKFLNILYIILYLKKFSSFSRCFTAKFLEISCLIKPFFVLKISLSKHSEFRIISFQFCTYFIFLLKCGIISWTISLCLWFLLF